MRVERSDNTKPTIVSKFTMLFRMRALFAARVALLPSASFTARMDRAVSGMGSCPALLPSVFSAMLRAYVWYLNEELDYAIAPSAA